MTGGDFYGSEVSTTVETATSARIELVGADGRVTVLKDKLALKAGEVIDAAVMSRKALRAFIAAEIAGRQARGRAVLAASEGDHDEDLRSHHVRPRRVGLLRRRAREARRHAEEARRQPQQRLRRSPGEDRDAAGGREGRDRGRHRGGLCEPAAARHGQFRQGHHQPARAERRDRRRLDAGDDPRVGPHVGPRRQAARRQGGDPGPLLRDDLSGGHRGLQGPRRVRSQDHGHRCRTSG